MKKTPLKRKTPLKAKKPWRSKNKFRAKPIHDLSNGDTFDSTGEHDRYRFLQMLDKGGAISDLKLHPVKILVPKTKNGPGFKWKLDYSYIDDGILIWEDYKPRPLTARDRVNFKLWKHFGDGVLLVTKSIKGAVSKRIMGGTDKVEEG